MGYETRLIIGFLSSGKVFPGEHGRRVIKIADFDLCKCTFHNTWIEEEDKNNPVNASIDRNENCSSELYNAPLYGIDPQKVLTRMKDSEAVESYRRYRAAIPMLESLIRDFQGQELTCILYGH